MREQRDGIVNIGTTTYVLAREIVAIHDGERVVKTQQTFQPWASPLVRGWVFLRNGQAVPAYVTARTIYRRWSEALREGQD